MSGGVRLLLLGLLGLAMAAGMVRLPGAGDAAIAEKAREAGLRFERAKVLLHARRDAAIDESTRAELRLTDEDRTGFVGVEWSPLTSSPGYLNAKRASTDPRWPVIFLRWYRDAGLRPGDHVAILASGSFPALATAARIAADVMGLKPVVVASLTASNYGANVPEFDYWSMEEELQRAGLLEHRISWLTPGGTNDRGEGLEEGGEALLEARLRTIEARTDSMTRIEHPRDLAESISARERWVFGEGGAAGNSGAIRLVVNVGGHAANIGAGSGTLDLRGGMNSGGIAPDGDSVVHRSLRAGVPVLHVLGVEPLLSECVLAAGGDPDLLVQAPVPMIRIASLVLLLILLWLAWKFCPAAHLAEPYQIEEESRAT